MPQASECRTRGEAPEEGPATQLVIRKGFLEEVTSKRRPEEESFPRRGREGKRKEMGRAGAERAALPRTFQAAHALGQDTADPGGTGTSYTGGQRAAVVRAIAAGAASGLVPVCRVQPGRPGWQKPRGLLSEKTQQAWCGCSRISPARDPQDRRVAGAWAPGTSGQEDLVWCWGDLGCFSCKATTAKGRATRKCTPSPAPCPGTGTCGITI